MHYVCTLNRLSVPLYNGCHDIFCHKLFKRINIFLFVSCGHSMSKLQLLAFFFFLIEKQLLFPELYIYVLFTYGSFNTTLRALLLSTHNKTVYWLPWQNSLEMYSGFQSNRFCELHQAQLSANTSQLPLTDGALPSNELYETTSKKAVES